MTDQIALLYRLGFPRTAWFYECLYNKQKRTEATVEPLKRVGIYKP